MKFMKDKIISFLESEGFFDIEFVSAETPSTSFGGHNRYNFYGYTDSEVEIMVILDSETFEVYERNLDDKNFVQYCTNPLTYLD